MRGIYYYRNPSKHLIMDKEFIPYEQALELKELGFDYETSFYYTSGRFGYYVTNGNYNYTNSHWMFNANDGKDRDKMCTAPLYQQAFRWFREKHGLFANHLIYMTMDGGFALESIEEDDQTDGLFNTYEEAELTCLKKLIEIVKNI